MRTFSLLCFAAFLLSGTALFAVSELNPNEVRYEPAALKEIFPSPWQIFPGIEDRTRWEQCRKRFPKVAELSIRRADKLLAAGPLAAPSDADFLLIFSTGDREKFQKSYFRLQHALGCCTLAAGFTGDPKYAAYAEQLLLTCSKMRTWVLPAHDLQKTNFNGTYVTMDLGSTMLARDVAAARQLLDSRLAPETKQTVDAAIRKFILTPLATTVAGTRKPEWYFSPQTSNWNAVCIDGLAGTLLLTEMNADARAKMLSWCLERSRYYLNSFTNDGYCTEGVGYWCYGYGHYLELALEILQASGGKLNLALREKAKLPGRYIDNVPLTPDCYPAFADCNPNANSCRRIIGLRDILWDQPGANRALFNHPRTTALTSTLLHLQLPEQPVFPDKTVLAENSAFPVAGIFLCRPGNKGGVLAAAFKGGSNHELHNHSDVGNFILAVDGIPVVDDAGAEIYRRQTFGPERYQSKIINSYGHSVPRIGGQLQINGPKTDAKVLSKMITARRTVVKLDLSKVYPTGLKIRKLTREFHYLRGTEELFSVEDNGIFRTPQVFETAIITFGSCKREGNQLLLTYKGKSLAVEIETFGAAFTVGQEPVKANGRRKETVNRIAIRLTEPTAEPRLRLTFRPVK